MSPLPAPVWLASASVNAEHAWALRHINKRVHAVAAWLAEVAPSSEVRPTVLRLEAAGRITAAALGQIAHTLANTGIAHELKPAQLPAGKPGRRPQSLEIETHTINPYVTIKALMAVARDRGVEIHEHTAVRKLVETQDGVEITLANGRVMTAGKVIVATNAYSTSIEMPVKVPARVVYNYMIATRELDAEQRARNPELARPDGPFVVELNKAYVFYRMHEGRLLFGGIEKFSLKGEDDFAVPPDVLAGLRKHLAMSFPGSGLDAETAWGGRFHLAKSDLPVIRRVGANGSIIFNLGYGGTGVALTLLCGGLAAGVALGDQFASPDDRRLHAAIEGTGLPLLGGARFAAGVVAGVVGGLLG